MNEVVLFLKAAIGTMVRRIHTISQKPIIWALADQGVVSLGNFITSILLARNLSQVEYGNYLLVYAIIVCLNATHIALIIYPLSVKGAVADLTELPYLTTHYLLLTTVLTPFYGLILYGFAFAVGKSNVAFLAISALFLWQIQEVLRRALMSHLRQYEAIWGDALSYLGQAALVWLLVEKGWLSMESTFLVIALTSGLAAAVQALQLKPRKIALWEVWNSAKAAWSLGKWTLMSSLATIITVHSTPWVLAIFHGSRETASFQAIANILGVSNPVIFSFNNLIVPAVAQANLKGGMKAVNRVSFNYGVQGGLLLFPLYLVLALFPSKVLELMYGSNSPYLKLDTILRLFVLFYFLLYVSQILTATLGGLAKSKSAFLSQMVGTISFLVIGIPLMINNGVFGTAIGSICSTLIRIVLNTFQVQRLQISSSKNKLRF